MTTLPDLTEDKDLATVLAEARAKGVIVEYLGLPGAATGMKVDNLVVWPPANANSEVPIGSVVGIVLRSGTLVIQLWLTIIAVALALTFAILWWLERKRRLALTP
jgi:hypothetical protein